MSTPYMAGCYKQWIHCADALKSFNLDPYLRTNLDVKVPIPEIADLYVEMCSFPQKEGDTVFSVTLSCTDRPRLCSNATDATLGSAYHLACLRFLGLLVEFEAQDRRERQFEWCTRDGGVKDGEWISFHDNAPPRIFQSYQEAKETDGDNSGWWCRQYLAPN